MEKFLFTMERHKVQIRPSLERFELQPFGDVHHDAPSCSVERWKSFLSFARKNDTPTTRYLGMGDYMELCATSERKKLKRAELHEESDRVMDREATKRLRAFYKDIKFMKGKLLGLLEGNHYWLFDDRMSGTQKLAQWLDCPYLGWLSVIEISLNTANSNSKSLLSIVANHGKSGGKLLGTSLNQIEDLEKILPLKDIYLMGHDHQRGAWPHSVLQTFQNKGKCFARDKRVFYGRTGSFKRGFVEGESTYVCQRLLRPADIGVVRFYVSVKRRVSEKGSQLARKCLEIQAVI